MACQLAQIAGLHLADQTEEPVLELGQPVATQLDQPLDGLADELRLGLEVGLSRRPVLTVRTEDGGDPSIELAELGGGGDLLGADGAFGPLTDALYIVGGQASGRGLEPVPDATGRLLVHLVDVLLCQTCEPGLETGDGLCGHRTAAIRIVIDPLRPSPRFLRHPKVAFHLRDLGMLVAPLLESGVSVGHALLRGRGVDLLPTQPEQHHRSALAGTAGRVESLKRGPAALMSVDPRLNLVPGRGQRVDLGVVDPAELECGRVVDAAPVVLFEPRPSADETLQGDGALVLFEFGRGLDAGDVELVGQSPVEPRLERPRHGTDLADQAVRTGAARRSVVALVDHLVDEAHAEVLGVHGGGYPLAEVVGDEHGAGESRQDPLNRRTPPELVRVDVEQFAGEGELPRIESGRRAHELPGGQEPRVDIGAMAKQRLELGRDPCQGRLLLIERTGHIPQHRVVPGAFGILVGVLAFQLGEEIGKLCRGVRQCAVQSSNLCSGAGALVLDEVGMIAGTVQLQGELVASGTGCPAEPGPEVVGARALLLERGAGGRHGGLGGQEYPARGAQFLLHQLGGDGGLDRGECSALGVELIDPFQYPGAGRIESGQRFEVGDLVPDVDDRPVCLAEFGELLNCTVGDIERARLVQHEVAEELVETRQGFCRERPVQQ